MLIAHNLALATNVVRIDLKRSVSISPCALHKQFIAIIAMSIANICVLATYVVKLEQSVSISLCAILHYHLLLCFLPIFGQLLLM